MVKNSPAKAGDIRNMSSIPGLGTFPGPSQLAHHLGSASSETGSGRALDGGCSVIRMAAEAPVGAKSFSCRGSEFVAVSAAIHAADGFGSGRRVHP